MKKIILTQIISGIFFIMNAQIPYYDAIRLNDISEIKKNGLTNGKYLPDQDSVFMVLGKYCSPTTTDKQEIVNQFTDNPFISIYVSTKINPLDSGIITRVIKGNVGKLFSTLPSKVGGLDVTTLSQGLSQFMIERAKEELNVAFFEQFKNFVKKNKDIEILFPVTTPRLSNMLSYQYSQMLTQLREAFYEDLNNLPDNLINFLESDQNKEFRKIPELLFAVKSIKMVRKLDYLSPPEFIEQLPAIADIDTNLMWIQNAQSALNLTSIFSNAIRDTLNQKYWITSDDLYKNILSNKTANIIFLGLIYQELKNKEIKFNNKLLIKDIINNKETINWYGNKLSQLINLTSKINYSFNEIKKLKTENSTINNSNIYSYINTTLEITEFGNDFLIKYGGTNSSSIEQNINYAKQANNIYKYTYLEQYSSAIIATVDLIEDILKKASDKKKKEYKWISKLTIYGTFMANIIDAQSADDAKNAITNAVLPAGSSSIKKYSVFNVAVGGYVGASYRLDYNKNQALNAWNSQWAVTAPVGLGFSTGFKKFGSLTITAVLIDIGAIVDYQLANDSTSINSKITLGNIFSPGGYIVYGMAWNLPISIGIGAQYGPGLSSIKVDDNTSIINSPNWRFGGFIAVDIPLFNIYNISKKR